MSDNTRTFIRTGVNQGVEVGTWAVVGTEVGIDGDSVFITGTALLADESEPHGVAFAVDADADMDLSTHALRYAHLITTEVYEAIQDHFKGHPESEPVTFSETGEIDGQPIH